MPRAALLLGWAGVVPFAILALADLLGLSTPLPVAPRTALLSYGTVILSFMGGVQWGLATAAREPEGGGPTLRFGVSVLPALWAWFSFLLLPPAACLLALAAGFSALLAYDLWSVRAGAAPAWYGRLRIQLTAAVVLLLLVALF